MISLIIPVYNERWTIRELVRRVCAVNIPKQIIIVDDGSTDGTRDILKAIEKDYKSFLLDSVRNELLFLFQSKNQGKGAAIRTAVKYITEPITLIQDADLEYDPQEYCKLIAPILDGYADVVYGSRFSGGQHRVLMFWHSVGNRILTLLSNVFTDLNLTDVETGYKVFRSEVIKGIPLRSNRFGFEPEITAKVAKLGCRIYEVPISYRGRTYSEGKKIGFKDGLQTILIILKYWLIDDLYSMEVSGLRTLKIMEGAGKYNMWLFQQFEPFLGQRILEMGAGMGNITHFLLDRELVVATDISEKYIHDLKQEFSGFSNVKVALLDFTDRKSVDGFSKAENIDTIVSTNVLEHIEDDHMAISGCFNILQPGGHLILLVPAHSVLYSKMDKNLRHFRRYNIASLRKVISDGGFRILYERYLNVLGAIGWFINGRVLGRNLIPSRQVRLFDFIVKLLAWEKFIKPPFGLSILLVAEKPSSRN